MLTSSYLELDKGWQTQTGSLVSGNDHPVVPDSYGVTAVETPGWLRFFATGKPWASWMAFNKQPVLPNSGRLALGFDIILDSSTANAGQLEFDVRLAIDGYDYNLSNQINQAAGNVWQIADSAGQWQTVVGLYPLAFNVPHSFIFHSVFDVKSKKKAALDLEIDGKVYQVPSRLQALAALPFNWEDTAIVQVQQNLSKSGGSVQQVMKNIRLEWS